MSENSTVIEPVTVKQAITILKHVQFYHNQVSEVMELLQNISKEKENIDNAMNIASGDIVEMEQWELDSIAESIKGLNKLITSDRPHTCNGRDYTASGELIKH